MRAIIVALVLLFLLLQYELWFSKGGVRTAWHLQKDITTQQAQNQKSQMRNKAVRADITDLRQGNQAVEERARNELGMVKKGETFYRVVKQ
ncbi:MAG: cell division protein FtsB [Gammaproteobacteria bacterium]|nr:cell division protein FtsB [Gammaproteobacteria bacterium]MCH9743910.1 cell division protein FtsB [Gammaproteobacteria bacterium]